MSVESDRNSSTLGRLKLNSHDARRGFESFVNDRGAGIPSMTPRSAVDAMVSFYRDTRVEDCDIESDGDMLLFQWGTYDWADEPRFEFDITRQLCRSGEDEDIWQLHLTFRFEPTEGLRLLGKGNRWCHSIVELDEFAEFVRSSRVFAQVADRVDVRPDLNYECAG